MGLNILLVDDQKTNILFLEALLEELECHDELNILTATNAKDAIEICHNKNITLIISDVEMPEISGIDMAKKLDDDPLTTDIPIIFITAKEQTEEFIEKSFDLGAVDFFTKPLNKHRVLTKIRLYLSLFNQRNQLDQYKKVIDNSAIAAKFDLDGKITYANQQLCKISGFSCEELEGELFKFLNSPNVSQDVCNDAWLALLTTGYWEGSLEKRRKNGDSYYVKESISAIRNVKGEPVEFMSIGEDITELKKLQLEELDKSVHKALDLHWNHLTEVIPIPSVIIDNDSIIQHHNALFREFAPVSKGEYLGTCFIEDENYVYDDGILDWKDVALNSEGQAKVLIQDGDSTKEYYLDLKKIDDEDLYLVCLHCIEENI